MTTFWDVTISQSSYLIVKRLRRVSSLYSWFEGINVEPLGFVMLVVFVTLAWYVGLGPLYGELGLFVCWARHMEREGLSPLYVIYVSNCLCDFCICMIGLGPMVWQG